MVSPFQKPPLWSRAFKGAEALSTTKAARLESAFIIFRERVAVVLERISKDLPTLTVHDITHVDALWETANLVVGQTYPLNPMETFVLGGAMLLHDSALTFDAYEKGLDGVRKTVQWRDAYATEKEKNGEIENPLDESALQAAADFAAVRLLHADQAPKLIEKAWIDPDTGSQIFLLEDLELRKHYGQIIGKIAASHNWDIEDVESKLPSQINAPGDWPTEWRIDPVKLACILRCADATHIDNRRAPDFLYALTRREGVSLQHWKAQNWLAGADLDQSDPTHSTLLFTSNREFQVNDADAWWIAHDAIQLVNKEIQSSCALLNSRPQKNISPPFSITSVAGVASPEAMNAFLRTNGWKPWHAELHVGNVQRLVKNLGGEKLYGGDKNEQFAIVLRELMQNARDAVAARRKLDDGYKGVIRVHLVDQGDAPPTLEVRDDGIGMSQRVLTGPFLDFGSSFWKSDLLSEEFPGLRSSGFDSVGRFGIGFYSIFMAADNVKVASRRWDRGINTVASLTFPKGLTLRPIYSIDPDPSFSGSVSTIVSCTLKSKLKGELIARKYKISPTQELSVPFADFVSRLTPALDVAVDVKVNDGEWRRVHEPVETIIADEASKHNWLKKITLSAHLVENIAPQLQDAAKRLQPIFVEGLLSGLAALSLENEKTIAGGIHTVGGFLSGGYTGIGGHRNYFGYMGVHPSSAKREAGKPLAGPDVLRTWAMDQIKRLEGRTLSIGERFALTHHLCDFNCDPTPFALCVFFKGQTPILLSLDQLFELMKSEPVALFRMNMIEHVEFHIEQNSYESYLTFKATGNSSFLSLKLNGDVPENPNSFIGCLFRRAQKDGYRLKFEIRPKVTKSLFGPIDVLILTLEKNSH